MTKEEMQVQGWIPAEVKRQQHRRALWHDYSQEGIYMMTMVTAGRRSLFGHLEGFSKASRGSYDAPRLVFSPLGKRILEEEVPKITEHYPMVKVWRVAMMPDHIHLLLRVDAPLPKGKHLGAVLGGFKAGCSRAWWRLMDEERGIQGGLCPSGNPSGTAAATTAAASLLDPSGNPSGTAAPTTAAPASSLVPSGNPSGTAAATTANPASLPAASSPFEAVVPEGFPEGGSSPSGAPSPAGGRYPAHWASYPLLFEDGYHDRIIKREGMLDNIRRYMDENPLRAIIRRECPNVMQRRLHLWIHDREYAAFGNLFLLKNPDKVQVFFHRKDAQGTPTHLTQEYAAERARLLRLAEEGAVLVTPGISKGEQGVVSAALAAGLPLILLQKEPITEFWKPQQSRFYACAEGRLLILAPWSLDANSDYERFHTLNDLARDVCIATDTRILNYSSLQKPETP